MPYAGHIEIHYIIAEHLEYAANHNKKAALAHEGGLHDKATTHARIAAAHYHFVYDKMKQIVAGKETAIDAFNRDILAAFGTQTQIRS